MSSRFLFTLFSLLCCTFLGLVAGRSANVTVDDSGVDPISNEALVYSPGWHNGNKESNCKHCPSSAYNETWHAVPPGQNSGQGSQTVSFKFNGSAIYVIGILTTSSNTADLSFTIDGQPVGNYKSPSVKSDQYNYTLYANSSITAGNHSFSMQQSVSGDGKSPPVFLDYIQYSRDDGTEDEDNSDDDGNDDGNGNGNGHGHGHGGGGGGGSSGSHSSQTIIIACAVALTVVLVVVLLLLLYTCRHRIFGRRRRTTIEKKEKFVEIEDQTDTESLPEMEPYTFIVASGPPPVPEKGRTLRLVNSPPSLSTSSQSASPSRIQPSQNVLSTPPAAQPRPMRPIPGARVVYPWRRQPPNSELPPSYEVSTFVV